jgi:fluoroacetyl-CoA thioesterase
MQMDATSFITVGLRAERRITVTHDMTVQHFVPSMPAVYGTPIMILHMEMTSGDAIASVLPSGVVTVGTAVDIRHLAATPVGREVRVTAVVTKVERKVVWFEVEAYDGDRKIGDGRHARGVVNTAEFKSRFAVT